MYIERKLDEIRQKPEHIRLRYVYFFVALFTFFFFIIWVFSFSKQIDDHQSATDSIIPANVNDQKNQLLDTTKNIKNNLDQATTDLNDSTAENTGSSPSAAPSTPDKKPSLKDLPGN